MRTSPVIATSAICRRPPGVLTPNGAGAFIAKMNAAGTALSYLTYIGSGGQVLTPFFTPGEPD